MTIKTLGRYELLEPLGTGAMGAVYRAHDNRLGRQVALKLLQPALVGDEPARERLRREAIALSRLNHPNIAALFDFDSVEGVDFLVMEYVPGTTLAECLRSGPLREDEVVRAGIDILEALGEAHEKGIIHRDLKPGNIMLTPKGRVKVLDFGLAKLLRTPDETLFGSGCLTETGATVGTLPYMAPEQLRGEDLDYRSDLYAVGTVLYELATGRRAFGETRIPALIEAILREVPSRPRSINPSLSETLDSVILKAIEKDPSRRYESAPGFVQALRAGTALSPEPSPKAKRSRRTLFVGGAFVSALALGAVLITVLIRPPGLFLRGDGEGIRSLAVLPVRNMTGDPGLEYLADGTTDQLITDLGQIGNLRVISLTSVLRYKNSDKSLPDIARELKVDAVVEGSLARSGDRMRINAKLIDATTERQLLVQDLEDRFGDPLELQRRVARAVAAKFKFKLTPLTSRPGSESHVDSEAYRLYLKGRHLWSMRTKEGLEKALEYFNRAVQTDKGFALAYVGIADCYNLFERYGVLPPEKAFPQAKAAARNALLINEALGEAYISLAFAEFLYDRSWDHAARNFERGLELNPNYATGHHWFSVYLRAMGDSTGAVREAELAVGVDPLSAIILTNLGDTYFYLDRAREAIDPYHTALELDPSYLPALTGLAYADLSLGEEQDAKRYLEAVQRIGPADIRGLVARAYFEASVGDAREAKVVLDSLRVWAGTRYVSAVEMARIHLALNDTEGALACLDSAYVSHDAELVYLRVDPRLEPLREDKRFRRLLDRVGFQP